MKKVFLGLNQISKRKKILAIIVFTGVVLIAVIASTLSFVENAEDVSNTEDDISNATSYPGIISYLSGDKDLNLANENKNNKFFYVKDNNIWARDLATGLSKQLTNYPKNNTPSYDENSAPTPYISINNIFNINDINISFSSCAVFTGDFGCGIYMLDLKTLAIKEMLKLNKDSLLLDVGFFSIDKFAYLYSEDSDLVEHDNWIFAIYHNGEIKLLDYPYTAFGRGFHPEDTKKISFSKDGNFVLQIATDSPIAMFDFNTYLYDLKNDKKIIIPNSTQPSWLNDTQIIYKGFDAKLNIGTGLYIYDTVSDESSKITDISATGGFPNVLKDNRIIYKDKGDIWLYDFNIKESRKLLISATVFSVINDVKFSYVDVIPCNGKENCGGLMGNYEYGKEKVFDIQKMESMDLNI